MKLSFLKYVTSKGRATNRRMGFVDRFEDGKVQGWYIGAESDSLVALLVDNMVLAVARANLERPDVVQAGFADRPCGFEIDLTNQTRLEGADVSFVGLAADGQDGVVEDDLSRYDAETVRSSGSALIINENVMSELKAQIIRTSRSIFSPTTQMFVIDISDLLIFLRTHRTVTGIQRMSSCLIRESLSQRMGVDQALVEFGMFEMSSPKDLRILARECVRVLIDDIMGNSSQAAILESLATILDSAQDCDLRADDVLFIPGAYWIVEDYTLKLHGMRERGVLLGAYIHDIIPITFPEWVPEQAAALLENRAADILSVSHFLITNSDFVAKDVHAVCKAELDVVKPICVARLPHELPGGLAAHPPDGRAELDNIADYVLCVGTIEGRKNHKLLFHIWASLIRKHGITAVPSLILVGRWGWNIEEFRDLCEASEHLAGKIRVISGVSDDYLASFYAGCLFTVFPSFVEGWGLPVGESLAAGKLCIASRTTSIPEVGGAFVDYFDPHDFLDAYKMVERCVMDRAYLAARTAAISEGFTPRTWKGFAADLYAAVPRLLEEISSSGVGAAQFVVRLGFTYKISAGYLVEDASSSWHEKQIRFVLRTGWRSLLGEGNAWSTGSSADIRFGVIGASPLMILALKLCIPEPNTLDEIVLTYNSQQSTHEVASGGTWVELEIDAANATEISVRIDRPRHMFSPPNKMHFFGLSDLCLSLKRS